MSCLIGLIAGGISVGVGAAYAGVSYLKGIWPFTRIEDNVYEITQWLTAHKGPALKGPGPSFYPYPLIYKKRDPQNKGEICSVSMKPRGVDFELSYVAKPGLPGIFKEAQFTYVIPTKEDAKKYFWEGRKDIDKVHQKVFSAITEEIAKREGKTVLEEISDVYKNVLKTLDNPEGAYSFIRENYGIKIVGISLSSVKWSNQAEEALSRKFKAEQDAEAEEIKAEAEIKIAKSHAEATQISIDSYDVSTKKTLELAGFVKGDPGYGEAYIKQYNIYFKTDNYQRYNNATIVVDNRESSDGGLVTPVEKNGPNRQNSNHPKDNSDAPKEETFKDLEPEARPKTTKETLEDMFGRGDNTPE